MKMIIILTTLLMSFYTFSNTLDPIGLDVRNPYEIQQNPAPGSLSIPLATLKSKALEKLTNKESKILVFCEAGVRAQKALKILTKLGYENVQNIGSWRDWNKLNETSNKK